MRNQKMFQMGQLGLVATTLSGLLCVTALSAQAVETCDSVKNEKAEQGYVCQVYTAGGPVFWSLEIKTSAGRMVWKDHKSGLFVSDHFLGTQNYYQAKVLCNAPQVSPPEFDPRGGLSSIQWRLPSGYPENMNGQYGFPNEDSDWVTLEKNGIRKVLPPVRRWYWSSSVLPDYAGYAYVFNDHNGDISHGYRNYCNYFVRCVGR